MARLVWDKVDYEVGVERGVFYPKDAPGVAWSGLTSVKESPSDPDQRTRYIDGIRTRRRRPPGEFSGTIEAFTYPDSFFEDYRYESRRSGFGLSYVVKDKIHLVYNIVIGPTQMDYRHLETDPFSWGFTTMPIPIPGQRMSAHLVIDKAKAYSTTVAALEDVLYGSESSTSRLPSPEEVLNIFDINAVLKVTDNGDGSFTVEGPDDVIRMLDPTTFEITWPSAVYIDGESYTLSSL